MPLPQPTPRPNVVQVDESGFREFTGIINVGSHREIGHKGLVTAQHVEVDDAKRLRRRDGYSLFASGAFLHAYASNDQSTLYAIIGTNLVRILDDGTQRVLKSGLSGRQRPGGFSWSEDASNYVSYTNGLGDQGILRLGLDWYPLGVDTPRINNASLVASGAHETKPFHLGDSYTSNTFRIFVTYSAADGRESAPSAVWEITAPPETALIAVDVDVNYAQTNLYACAPGGTKYVLVGAATSKTFTANVQDLYRLGGPEYPYTTGVEGYPNNATRIKHHDGQLFASEHIPERNMSVVWISLPMQYHLFNKTEDYFTVISEVQLLLSTSDGLLVGTDNQIYVYKEGTLTELTQYGVIPGRCGDVMPDGTAYFWTLRGPARYPKYELLTEQTFSGDPGVFNNAHLMFMNGYVKLLASTITGNPVFNQRTER